MSALAIASCLCLLLGWAGAAPSQAENPMAGDVTPDFGVAGRIWDPISGGDEINDMVVDGAGRTILVGSTRIGGQTLPTVSRVLTPLDYDPARDGEGPFDPTFDGGSLDPTFDGGRLSIPISGQEIIVNGEPNGVGWPNLPDWASNEADAALTTVMVDTSSSEHIVAGGWIEGVEEVDGTPVSTRTPVIVRLDSSGKLVEDFGTEGVLVLDEPAWASRGAEVSALMGLGDGSVLVGITEFSTPRRRHLVRLTQGSPSQPGGIDSQFSVEDVECPEPDSVCLEQSGIITLPGAGEIVDFLQPGIDFIVIASNVAAEAGGEEIELRTWSLLEGETPGEIAGAVDEDAILLSAPVPGGSVSTRMADYGVELYPIQDNRGPAAYIVGTATADRVDYAVVARMLWDNSAPVLDASFGAGGWYVDVEDTQGRGIATLDDHILLTGRAVSSPASPRPLARFLTAEGDVALGISPGLPLFGMGENGVLTDAAPGVSLDLLATSPDGALTFVLYQAGLTQEAAPSFSVPQLYAFASGNTNVDYSPAEWPSPLLWGFQEPNDTAGIHVGFTRGLTSPDLNSEILPTPTFLSTLFTRIDTHVDGNETKTTVAGIVHAGDRGALVISRYDEAGGLDSDFSSDGQLWLEVPLEFVVTAIDVAHSGEIAVVVQPLLSNFLELSWPLVLLINADGQAMSTTIGTVWPQWGGNDAQPWADFGIIEGVEFDHDGDGAGGVILAVRRIALTPTQLSHPDATLENSRQEVGELLAEDEDQVGLMRLNRQHQVGSLTLDTSFGAGASNDSSAWVSTPPWYANDLLLFLSATVKDRLIGDEQGNTLLLLGNAVLPFDRSGLPRPHSPVITLDNNGNSYTPTAFTRHGNDVVMVAMGSNNGIVNGVIPPLLMRVPITITSEDQIAVVEPDTAALELPLLWATSIAVDQEQGFLLGGVGPSAFGAPFPLIFRLDRNGVLDTDFGASDETFPGGVVMPYPRLDIDGIFSCVSVVENDLFSFPFTSQCLDGLFSWLGTVSDLAVVGEHLLAVNTQWLGPSLITGVVRILLEDPAGTDDNTNDGTSSNSTVSSVAPLLPTVLPTLQRTDTTLTCAIGEFSQNISEVSVRLVINGAPGPTQTLPTGVRSATWTTTSEWAGASISCEVLARAGSAISTTQSGAVLIPKPVTPTPTPTPTVSPTTSPTSGVAVVRRSVTFSGTQTQMTATQVRAVRAWAQRNGGATEIICRASTPTAAGAAQARARAKAACAVVARIHRGAEIATRVKITRNKPQRTVVVTLRIPRS